MKKAPAKQKILHILKRKRGLTIDEIMPSFSISEIAVRRHINELEKQGLIRKNVVKQKIGRPYYTYELTKEGHQTFPNQYEQLPVDLLKDLESIHGKQAVVEVLEQRMVREREAFEQRISSDDFDKKVEEVAQIQDEKGYMVELEKNEAGDYEMVHYNCPIANIALTYRQVCKNEKRVFSEVFKTSEVIPKTCITSGDHFCKWLIKKPEER